MLGDNIRRLRKEKKLSINKLSELSGVALGYLSMIENNKANPTMDKIDDIAGVLETTSSELLSTEEKLDLVINSIEKIMGLASQGLGVSEEIVDYKYNKHIREDNIREKNKIETIAAHFEGKDFTDKDVEDIENFIEFILTRKQK